MAYNHIKAMELWEKFLQNYANDITDNIKKAGEFAIDAHIGQVRKNEAIPYVSHLFDVAGILIDNRFSENLIIAGLLHDIMEDTKKTKDDILGLFSEEQGQKIIEIILADTETDTNASWKERKQATIDLAQSTCETEGLLLICADKIANLGSLNKALDIFGDKTWDFFNSGKENQIWYYTALFTILKNKLPEHPKMMKQYEERLEKIKIG